MISVNAFPDADRHVPLLMGLLLQEMSRTFAAEDWDGLRQSHFRVLTSVPDGGVSVTDLAARVGMTKQGCGQFVTTLAASGHLVVERSSADRRLRLVHRTDHGDRVVEAVRARIARVEDTWARRVGAERFAVFRGVLAELAAGAG